MDFDTRIQMAVYRHFAETGRRPAAEEIADQVGVETEKILDAYGRLHTQRRLVLEADGSSIRMALPFSGVPTQHVGRAKTSALAPTAPGTSWGTPNPCPAKASSKRIRRPFIVKKTRIP